MASLSIQELVLNAEKFANDERTPFAREPWIVSSEVLWREGNHTAPFEIDGQTFAYFLEPSIICELKESFSTLEPASFVERVIQYAKNDA